MTDATLNVTAAPTYQDTNRLVLGIVLERNESLLTGSD